MDVDKIQKINKLALDLVKQGLATDHEDAVAQAERIYHGNTNSDYQDFRRNYNEIRGSSTTPGATQSERVSAPSPQSTVVPELSQDKIQEIMEKNTRFIVEKMKEFQDKVTTLEAELAILKTKLNYARPVSESAPRQRAETSPQQQMVPRGMPSSGDINSSVPKNHPRSGNYTDQDVSIEKFFYRGNK